MKNFISFKSWLKTNAIYEEVNNKKNLHMTHTEDLVLLGGKDGLNWVINMFKELYEKLESDTDPDKIRLSVKFDGAPSVFVWQEFPGMEAPGLAIKALFAKNPKIMYSNDQVDHYYGAQSDMARKLKYMLKYIPSLNIPKGEIWQGDFLFDKHSLIKEKEYYTFHPNTIIYKVPKNSDIGEKIENADIGVVWHTRYEGNSLNNISAKYNTKIHELNENPKVFMTDPYIASLAGIVTLTEDESDIFRKRFGIIETLSKNLYKNAKYNTIIDNKDLLDLFSIFQNSLIRINKKIEDPSGFIAEFKEFLQNRFSVEAEKRKTQRAKDDISDRFNKIINQIEENEEVWIMIVNLITNITQIKDLFIRKLNNIGKFKTFLQTNENKFLPTNQEGFAVSDINGNVVKLVDRYEFSFANFSPTIKKGWSK